VLVGVLCSELAVSMDTTRGRAAISPTLTTPDNRQPTQKRFSYLTSHATTPPQFCPSSFWPTTPLDPWDASPPTLENERIPSVFGPLRLL